MQLDTHLRIKESFISGQTVQGVDCSFDYLLSSEAYSLIRGGVEVYWQCLWTGKERPRAAAPNLKVAFDAGFKWVGAYISLNGNPTISGGQHMRYGKATVPPDIWDRLDFVAVDAELPGITLRQIVHAVSELEILGKPVARGENAIYTSYNFWTNVLQGKDEYPPNVLAQLGVLLINAFWDKHPDVDYPKLQYGGWHPDQVLAEQWSGGYLHPSGQYVDRNTFMVKLLKRGDEMDELEEVKRQARKLAAHLRVAQLGSLLAIAATAGQSLHVHHRDQIRYLLDLADAKEQKGA